MVRISGETDHDDSGLDGAAEELDSYSLKTTQQSLKILSILSRRYSMEGIQIAPFWPFCYEEEKNVDICVPNHQVFAIIIILSTIEMC